MEPNRQKSVAVSVEKQKPRGHTGYAVAVCLELAPQAPRFLHCRTLLNRQIYSVRG